MSRHAADTTHYTPTADAARICLLRRKSDGPPVILLHGLAVNADIWAIPDIHADGLTYRSLTSLLHEAGCDVWRPNLRGLGSGPHRSTPPPGQHDWCVDHFILFDLPAIVEYVRDATGRVPVIIASSMGAMTTAAYLSGARWQIDADGTRIVADPALARQRCRALAGCVLLEFPAALRWPKSAYDAQGWLDWRKVFQNRTESDNDSNLAFEMMARAGWLEAILRAAGEIRLDWMRPREDDRHRPGPLRELLAGWTDQALLRAAETWARRFKGSQHFCAETFARGLRRAVDHMKAGVLVQLARGVRARSFVSLLGQPQHDYTSGYPLIEAPLLVLLGGRDRIAHPQVTREVFFDRVASRDRTLRVFETIAHGEFEYAPIATQEVYPRIVEWVLARAGTGA